MLRTLVETYWDGGLAAVRRKASYVYGHLVQAYLQPRMRTWTETVVLNSVEVPVDRSPVDRLPFYEPTMPTADRPAYEAAEVAALRRYGRPGDHVVVVGGGLGVTAVVAARAVGPGGRVTVFEPAPAAARVAARTVRRYGLAARVRLVRAAVGAPSATCFTYWMPPGVPSLPPGALPAADVYEVDCEGAEVALLRHLPVRPRVLLIETHDNHEAVVALLRARGYALDSVVDDRGPSGPDRTHVRAHRG